jgi:hypothetical protein
MLLRLRTIFESFFFLIFSAMGDITGIPPLIAALHILHKSLFAWLVAAKSNL